MLPPAKPKRTNNIFDQNGVESRNFLKYVKKMCNFGLGKSARNLKTEEKNVRSPQLSGSALLLFGA